MAQIIANPQEFNFGLYPLSVKGALVKEAFLAKLQNIVMENISDEHFGIRELCKAMIMSNGQVYRRLKTLTGKSISQYIRGIRIYHAKKLLVTTDMNVSEVAYEVGFKDPLHFSRVFSKTFGAPPKTFKK